MKKYILFSLFVLNLLIFGCAKIGLSKEQAIEIAQNSECTEQGKLTDEVMYNENTKTWWIDLDLEKEGCNPACVVDEETGTASINWRCTGLIQ